MSSFEVQATPNDAMLRHALEVNIMPRYFLNIRDHDVLIADPDGDEAASMATLRDLADQIIGDILGRPETYGRRQAWDHRSFEITDEAGAIVLVVPFGKPMAGN